MGEPAAPWVELLLTDSLARPLAGASFLVLAGTPAEGRVVDAGTLDGLGRTAQPWRTEGLTVVVGYRALVLWESHGDELHRTRDRLTCLGYDAGSPDHAAEPERVARSLESLARCAAYDGIGTPGMDPRTLLEELVGGDHGLAEPAVPAEPRRRRRPRHARHSSAGSHLSTYDALDSCIRPVNLAVSIGPRGSRWARNRVVVYDWFTGLGSQPCAGNDVRLLIDGEEAWGAVARDIGRAHHELCLTTWWADPDIELVRPLELAQDAPERRAHHRFAAHVEALARRGGRTAILLWNWLGTPIVQRTLRRWAVEAGDNVEVLQRAHPTVTGSFHQKTIVVDRRVAYCGGFNLRQNDWDTQEHRLDDPRRNPHRSDALKRTSAEPAYPPRHDVAVRIEGPLVFDVHDDFAQKWNTTLARERRGLRRLFGKTLARISGFGPSSRVEPLKRQRLGAGPAVAQFVSTVPGKRRDEQAIYDVLIRAIRNARRLIYIENQFFRSLPIARALAASLRQHPNMGLIVVTNQITAPLRYAYGAAWHTWRAQQRLREQRPELTVYQLLGRGPVDGVLRYSPIEVHSKVMVVDDEWVTVGSANLNERSILSETEANVAIEDVGIARGLRCRLMAEHLGLAEDDPRLSDQRVATELWQRLAAENAAAKRRGEAALGHAHPFVQQPSWEMLKGRARWF